MVILADEGTAHPYGEAMFQELRWIHDLIRRNLELIAQVVEQVLGGAPVEQVRAQIDELASGSVVWTLRVNCLQYCRFVHGHHHFEDAAWFPALRRANPQLQPVIDRLEADHVLVSNYLDAVEDAAQRIAHDEAARADLAASLTGLAEHLLAHLEYEETSLAPTLRRIKSWPSMH